MLSLFQKYALSIPLYCTLIALCCTSCSFLSPNEAETNQLNTQVPEFDLVEIQSSPYVYEIKQKDSALSQKYFLTQIKDCKGNNYKSLGTAARRLLVGLEDIRIRELNTVTSNKGSITQSRTSANYDEIPIDIMSYTLEESGCIKDVAVWTSISKNDNEEKYESRGKTFKNLEETIVSKIING